MKRYFRQFVINTVALWTAKSVLPGVSIPDDYKSLLVTALVLTLVNLLVRPLIKLLILPVNLLTLGAFRWVVNVAALYFVTLIVPEFKVVGFVFEGLNYSGFIIPGMYITALWALVLTSFAISLTTTFLLWLAK